MNKVTIKNKYPLLRTEDLMDQLIGICVFIKIDLQLSYHHIRVKPEDIKNLHLGLNMFTTSIQ